MAQVSKVPRGRDFQVFGGFFVFRNDCVEDQELDCFVCESLSLFIICDSFCNQIIQENDSALALDFDKPTHHSFQSEFNRVTFLRV